MFTDIKGFSAMMGADEATTIQAVVAHRALVREALARHEGREQRTIGDAFLILFDSAVRAVACAVEIQELLLARNAQLPKNQQVWLRIGVHAGEVVIDGDGELAGDAVNIAARVEPHAPVGGICLTEVVAAQVRSHVSRRIEPLPAVQLKNIANPPALFQIAVAPVAPPARRSPWRVLVAAAGAVSVAAGLLLGPWNREDGPRRWPVASADTDAQEQFEVALEAFSRGDSSASRLARRARDADPRAPYAALLAALEDPTAPNDDGMRATLALVEGRDEPVARLVRLLSASSRQQRGGVGIYVGSELTTQWDAWGAENPDDVFGQFLRALHYPVHGAETDFHAADPDREHLNAIELRKFLAQHPDWAIARVLLVAFMGPKENPAAPALLADGLALCPTCAVLEVALGQWLATHDRHAEARTSLRRAITLDPSIQGGREGLASLALREDDETERQRLSAALMGPEEPARTRAQFATVHAFELLNRGRVREASALFEASLDAFAEVGDVDTPLLSAVEFAAQLITLGETTLSQAICAEVARRLARPEVGEDARKIVGLRLLGADSALAWSARDLPAARAALEAIQQVPPDRVERAQLDPIVRDARTVVSVLSGEPLTAEGWGNLTWCASRFGRAEFKLYLHDLAALDELRGIVAPGDCEGNDPAVYVLARVLLAEHGDDRDRAALAEIDRVWPRPDADLAVIRRRAAVEATRR